MLQSLSRMQYEVCAPLTDHDHRCLEMTCRDRRKHARIRDAQPAHTVHAKLVIHHAELRLRRHATRRRVVVGRLAMCVYVRIKIYVGTACGDNQIFEDIATSTNCPG